MNLGESLIPFKHLKTKQIILTKNKTMNKLKQQDKTTLTGLAIVTGLILPMISFIIIEIINGTKIYI